MCYVVLSFLVVSVLLMVCQFQAYYGSMKR